MPDLTRHTRKMLVAALLAALTISACGDDDDKPSAAAGVTTTTAPPANSPTATTPTETKTNTTETPSSGNGEKAPVKVIPVTDPPRTLQAGGLKVEIDVDHLADPVRADVDEPQEGNRFVGVFLASQASGNYEPAKVTALASLTTKDGKSYPVRVISGGDCEGAFFPAAFVLKSKKARIGCVGFEIPKSSEPKEIALGVTSTTTGKGQTGKWVLPEA